MKELAHSGSILLKFFYDEQVITHPLIIIINFMCKFFRIKLYECG